MLKQINYQLYEIGGTRMAKKVLLAMLALFLLFTLSACTKDPGVDTVAEGKFTVGFDQDFPPMGFVGEDGEFTGFDLDLAAEVADRLGLELVLQPIAWDSKDFELESGNIDCIWNGFTINGREDKYTWTEPYMANNQVFVVRADSGISSLEDLAGKVVAVQTESSAEAALNDRPDLVDAFADLIVVPDYLTAMMDLESGAVDAVAMDDTVANYQLEKKGVNFAVLSETLAAEDYGVGFLLGNEKLRDAVQKTLEEMAADGTMAKISESWFGKDVTTIGK
jgi:polar amino acid transport system substrate-binding protein